jgi:hypothetical protein
MRGQSPQDKCDEQDKPHHHGPKCEFHQEQLSRWLAPPENAAPHGRRRPLYAARPSLDALRFHPASNTKHHPKPLKRITSPGLPPWTRLVLTPAQGRGSGQVLCTSSCRPQGAHPRCQASRRHSPCKGQSQRRHSACCSRSLAHPSPSARPPSVPKGASPHASTQDKIPRPHGTPIPHSAA